MRRLIEFPCAGDMLLGTLDEAAGRTGLLIVSGGNEIRAGAHRGMATLAAKLATAGTPVFRFDRRGVGDSSGENSGYAESAPDIAAAAATFCAESGITRLIGFGNCDAATALALFHQAAGIDALILANPWIVDDGYGMPSAAAIRARYVDRLRDPRAWLRALRGGMDIGKAISGLTKISRSDSQLPSELATQLITALSANRSPITILLAARDNSAIAFRAAWEAADKAGLDDHVRVETLDSASHSFASVDDKQWLFDRVSDAVARLTP